MNSNVSKYEASDEAEVSKVEGSNETRGKTSRVLAVPSAHAPRKSLVAADRIMKTSAGRHSTFDILCAPPDRVAVVPPDGATIRMAGDSGLSVEEINEIIEVFTKFDEDGKGELDMVEFEGALAAIFQIEEGFKVMPGPLGVAWEKARKDGLDGFLSWYTFARFNTNIAQLAIFAGASCSAFSVENLASEYNVPLSELMRVKEKFDEFDADGSGKIGGDEFKEMIAFFLKIKNQVDASDTELQQFWEEIDIDKSGSVDFAETVAWLVKEFPEYVAGGSNTRNSLMAKNQSPESCAQTEEEQDEDPDQDEEPDQDAAMKTKVMVVYLTGLQLPGRV